MCIVQAVLLFSMCSEGIIIVLELATACLFLSFCLCCGVCSWNNDKGLCSKFVHINCVDEVVDGPQGW